MSAERKSAPLLKMKPLNVGATEGEGIDADGTWAISYGDMITLLLTFFILFFSLDKPSKEGTPNSIPKDITAVLATEPAAKPPDGTITGAASPDQVRLGADREAQSVEKKIMEEFGGELTKRGHQITVRFPGVSFFDSGKTELTRAGADHLRRFAESARKYPGKYSILVRAFTDGVPVKRVKGRPFQDNLELSGLRSIAAMRALAQAGLPLPAMRIAGFGEVTTGEEDSGVQAAIAEHRKIVLTLEPEWREPAAGGRTKETVKAPDEKATGEQKVE
jgi:chemotaxis protein MotB